MESTVVECNAGRCQSPQAAAPSDGAPAGCEGQEVTPTSSPDTNSPVLISVEVGRVQIAGGHALVSRLTSDGAVAVFQEIGSGSTSQKSDEEDFVKVEDLPLQLTVMCEVRIRRQGARKSMRDGGADGPSSRVTRRSFRRE